MRDSIARWLREPLLHFVVAGACIYGLYATFAPDEREEDDQRIVVTAGQIAWLEEAWQKRWNRPPTAPERQGLIDDYVEETVMYREALAMGLDEDDVIIRRRLRQKLEFLSQDLLQPAPPDDETLRAYFEAHHERYQAPDRITFTQVFLDPDLRDERTLVDAEALKSELMAQGEPSADGPGLGDPFMLQSYYPQRSEAEIAKLFGSGFAGPVAELAAQQWHGPVLSGYGVHLVYVHAHEIPEPISFAAAEERVREDWETERREKLNQQFIAGLVARYEVIVEEGPDDAGPVALVDPPR